MKAVKITMAASLLAIAVGITQPVFAQASANEPQSTEPQNGTPAVSAGIQDIIVTAQRREETLQRAAVALTALSGDQLSTAGVSDPGALNRLVPSLIVQSNGFASNFYIRGVGSFAANSFNENAIAFSVGGVFYGRPTAPAGAFYDLDRVEVLRGPQGTLYGRNATGGAINLVPTQPMLGEFRGNATLEYGNYNSIKTVGALNVPLGDKVAVRVAGQFVDHDGYLSDGYDDQHAYAGRVQLLVQPSDRFSILLAADYFHQGGRGPGTVLIRTPQFPNAPSPSRRIGASDPSIVAMLQARTLQLYANTPPFSSMPIDTVRNLVAYPSAGGHHDDDFWGISSTMVGDLDFADLTTILAYRVTKPDFLAYTGGFPAFIDETVKQMSAEVRLASKPGSRLGYVVGAFFFDEDQDSINTFNQGLFVEPTYAPRLNTTSKAAFGEVTYGVTDALRLVGGLRYTREDKKIAGALRSRSIFNPNAPFIPVSGSLSYEKVTWKAGVEFDAGPQSLLYATVATGFKAGGFYPSARENTFRPEALTAYTLGSKNRFLNNRLQANIEAFYWEYRDQQINHLGPVQTTPGNFAQAGITSNAGRARMFGADVELVFKPTRADTFSVNVQYLNSKYQSLVYNSISASGGVLLTGCAVSNDPRVANPPVKLYIVDCSGRPTVNSPKWSGTVSYEHVFEIGSDFELMAGGRSRLESSSWLNTDYLEYQRRDAFMMSDVYLTLTNKPGGWALTAFINNIEDEAVLDSGGTRPLINATLLPLRPPRTYGLRATYNF